MFKSGRSEGGVSSPMGMHVLFSITILGISEIT